MISTNGNTFISEPLLELSVINQRHICLKVYVTAQFVKVKKKSKNSYKHLIMIVKIHLNKLYKCLINMWIVHCYNNLHTKRDKTNIEKNDSTKKSVQYWKAFWQIL